MKHPVKMSKEEWRKFYPVPSVIYVPVPQECPECGSKNFEIIADGIKHCLNPECECEWTDSE